MAKRIYNQVSLFGPNYAFLVVLSPPEPVRNHVAQFKKEINAIAGIGERNLHSIGHITLTDKLTDDADFAQTIRNLLEGQKAFPIKLKGWKTFDHGHSLTLYIDVITPEPINALATLLKSSNKSPHLSLAKRISFQTFEKLKPWLDNLSYEAEWDCTEVIVLRKLMSEKHLGFRESFSIPLDKI